MLSSLEALRSFCLFATVCILMLWLSNMTLFLAVIVWDTRRVSDKRQECFGIFCCTEDTALCCGGKFASQKQREHCSEVITVKEEVAPENLGEQESTKQAIEKNSLTERICGIYLGSILFSKAARIILLILYGILISLAGYLVVNIEVYFDQSYFVSESSEISTWFAANE